MGFVGLLITAVIIAVLLLFFNSPFSSFNSSPSGHKDVKTQSEEAVNAALEKSQTEQKQIQDLEQ